MDIVITAWASPETETYSIWKDRAEPLCPYCFCEMMLVEEMPLDGNYPFDERWRCLFCGIESDFTCGDYGQDEVFVTAQEWQDRQAEDWQRYWLEKRYGYRPKSIRDYWISERST
jgi:hypothetical protein